MSPRKVLVVVNHPEGPREALGSLVEEFGGLGRVVFDDPMFHRCSHTWKSVKDMKDAEE